MVESATEFDESSIFPTLRQALSRWRRVKLAGMLPCNMAYTGAQWVTPADSEGVTGGGASKRPPRLLDEVRRVLRLKHYSLRTEQAYVAWIRRFARARILHESDQAAGFV